VSGLTDSVAVSCSVVVTITDDIVLSDVAIVVELALVHAPIPTHSVVLVSNGPSVAIPSRAPPVVFTPLIKSQGLSHNRARLLLFQKEFC
jgi:hypothetical protein